MAHSEAELKALTVVKLKELLAARSLPVTGKKDELIARLLEHPDAPLTADTTGPASATDEPDGTGLSGTAEASAAATGVSERAAGQTSDALAHPTEVASSDTFGNGSQEDDAAAKAAQQAQVDADRIAAARAEEDKRAARAARFGVAAPSAETPAAAAEGDAAAEAKRKRAERFGLPVADADADGATARKADDKLNKSLAALDAPLGSLKRQREPKKAAANGNVAPTSKNTGPAVEKGVVGHATAAAARQRGGVDPKSAAAEPAAAVAADPELKKRLEEEEEKKRKRAERFGAPPAEAPQEKKTKVDA